MISSSIFLQLREMQVFKNLPDKELEGLSKEVKIKRYDKNALIYECGENADHVFAVLKGKVKMGINTSCGKILIKNIIYPDAVFGENIFASGSRRKEFAKTLTDTSVIMIPTAIFKTLVEENQLFAADMANLILQRLNNLEQRMQAFVFKKAKRRIVDFIKKIGSTKGIKIGIDEILVNHGMSHKEIAFLTDTSRQTVARVLGELKKDDLIFFSARKPNKILIRNLSAL